MLEKALGLRIVAQFERYFAEIEQGACDARVVIEGNGGIVGALQMLLRQLIGAAQQQERCEGNDGLDQFLWPVDVMCSIERGKDDGTFLLEQFVICFVLTDKIYRIINQVGVRVKVMGRLQLYMGIVGDDLVQCVASLPTTLQQSSIREGVEGFQGSGGDGKRSIFGEGIGFGRGGRECVETGLR